MNRRNDSPGESHPGNPGLEESTPDQYGQEHYEHKHYRPLSQERPGVQDVEKRIRRVVDPPRRDS